MIVKWHRADETITIDTDLRENRVTRPCYYSTPVLRQDISQYINYPTNSDLAVSLVVWGRPGESNYSELMIKRIPWIVKNLSEQTDLLDCKIPIVVSISADLQDVALPYLEVCNYPLSAINWFENPDPLTYAVKMEVMRHPVFGTFERILHLDTSIVIRLHANQHPSSFFSSILTKWRDQSFARVLGERDIICGFAYGFTRKMITSNDFINLIRRELRDCDDDEIVLSKYDWGSDVADIKECFRRVHNDNLSRILPHGEAQLYVCAPKTSLDFWMQLYSIM